MPFLTSPSPVVIPRYSHPTALYNVYQSIEQKTFRSALFQFVKEYVEIINDIGGKKLEKDLENDLIDYKITIDPVADSLINDSDLRDFEMPDGG